MNKKVKFEFEFEIRPIACDIKNFCKECAFCVGSVGCMSRSHCPYTEEQPQVYKFSKVKKINKG